jgi:methyl-accepting chemotaxis protein
MNIQTPGPSAYAPDKVDTIRLASATVQAVDRIGAATSEEIEKTADEIMRGATEIAEKLRELAGAIREHSKIANEHVSGFCNKATSVLEGVRDLQMKLEVNGNDAGENDAAEDTSPLPSLVRKGPAESEELKL